MSEDMESIQNDVVRPIGVPLAFQSIHRQVTAIEIEIPKCDVTGIDDTDCIMPRAGHKNWTRSAVGSRKS